MNSQKISPALRKQIGQFSNEIPEKNLETPTFNQNEQPEEKEQGPNSVAIAQLKVEKEAFAKRRLEELREKMQFLARERQEQMRQRYQQKEEEQKQKETQEEKVKKQQPMEANSKKKGGFWGKRVKTAQDQSQPETAGKRTSG